MRALALVFVALLVARPARAQTGDASAATELFRQGRESLDAKDYASACPKLEESLRLDPHVGTLISLATCDEAIGKIARARARWQQAVDLARSLADKRESYAAEQLAAIDPRVPRLTITVGTIPTSYVRRDDVDVGGASLGVAIPVEVGLHTLVVSADGYVTKTTTIELAEHESKTIVADPGDPLAPPPLPPASKLVSPPPPTSPPPGSPLRPIAVATGAVGIVGIGIGAVLGLEVIHAKSSPAGSCTPQCDADGSARKTAVDEGNVSTVAFIAGGALVAAGVVLWMIAPKSSQRTSALRIAPRAGLRSFGLAIEGAF